MGAITEIAPDVYRISIYVPQIDMQFNSFVVNDEAPLLYHTGTRRMFPLLVEEMKQIIQPSQLCWIGFSHFEADECGSINEWLQEAQSAKAMGTVAAIRVNMADCAIREPYALTNDEVLQTGKYRFRMIPTPHLPHGWDAGMLFEETNQILFCSDLFHQNGDVEPVTQNSVVERAREVLLASQAGPLKDYMPYTIKTSHYLDDLAALKPKTLATQHGSTYVGDGESALHDLALVMKEVYEIY